MVSRRSNGLLDNTITARELGKFAAFAIPIVIGGIAMWVNLNNTLVLHTANQNAQAQELKTMHDEVAVISARQSETDEKLTRLMFYFRVPQEGTPFTVYPPQQRGKVEPLAPLKGHALFDVPQAVADAPALPLRATGADESR